jgi:hypothetical protein
VYLVEREKEMNGFSVSSFCDSLDDGYGVFDDVVDSLDFASVGIDASEPKDLEGDCPHNSYAWQQKTSESIKKNIKDSKGLIKQSLIGTKKRGKKPGQKGICSVCKVTGHNKRTCPSK